MAEFEVIRKKEIKNGYFKEKLYDLRVSPAFLLYFGFLMGMLAVALGFYIIT